MRIDRAFGRRAWLLAAVAIVASVAHGLADDPPAAGGGAGAAKDARRQYQHKIRSRQPAVRLEALEKLGDFPPREAAEQMLKSGLTDPDAEVRKGAIRLLAEWRDREEMTSVLLEKITQSTRKDGMDVRSIGVLKGLAGTESGALQKRLLKYLDEFLGSPRANQLMIHNLVDELGTQGDEDAFRSLKLFSQARYFEKNFGYRRCVVQGLVQVKVREAIPFLIELIPTLKGIVQFDVIMHLTRATGQNLRDDVAMWRAWWARQAAGEPLKESPPPPAELYGKFGSFYGLPICAKRVVFVVDTSGSMNGPKLDAAKRELIATIKELPQEVAFGLVIFSNSIRIWQGELVPATTQMKELAIKTVQSQEARGDTSTYDALEAAFTLDPEAIYLLSDGAPTSGKIVAPNEIVGTIAAFNKLRRVSIFTVGIDTNDTTAVMFARFMRGLAEANWGEYQAVKG